MTEDRNALNNLHMPYARFFPEGAVKPDLVVPARPGERVARGYVAYDPDIHYMRMQCPHCNIRADFNKGSGKTIAGQNLNGARPHLKKQPEIPHEESCILPYVDHGEPTEYDPKDGYRLHLDLPDYLVVKKAFNDQSKPLYERGGDHKIIINDQRLIGKQPMKLPTLPDLLRFMSLADPERLKKSLVVNRHMVIPFTNFVVGYDEQTRHQQFFDLIDRKNRGIENPVLMELRMHEAANGQRVFSQGIKRTRDESGRRHEIITTAYLNNDRVCDIFPTPGIRMALVLPRLYEDTRQTLRRSWLNLSIIDPVQIADGEFKVIERQARDHAVVLAAQRLARPSA